MKFVGFFMIAGAIVLMVVFSGVDIKNVIDLASLVIVVLGSFGAGIYLAGIHSVIFVLKLLFGGKPGPEADLMALKVTVKTMGSAAVLTAWVAFLFGMIALLTESGFGGESFSRGFAAALVPFLYALILNLLIFLPASRLIKIYQTQAP